MQRFGPPDCSVCQATECKGGGNLKCAQRDPEPSRIVGILDSYGGTRVLVCHEDRIGNHIRCGEFAIGSATHVVHEPIAWGDIPMVVHIGELAIERWADRFARSNETDKREAITLYRLRKLEHTQRSLDLEAIVYT